MIKKKKKKDVWKIIQCGKKFYYYHLSNSKWILWGLMCASSFLSKNFCCYPLRKVSKAMGGFFTLQKEQKKQGVWILISKFSYTKSV